MSDPRRGTRAVFFDSPVFKLTQQYRAGTLYEGDPSWIDGIVVCCKDDIQLVKAVGLAAQTMVRRQLCQWQMAARAGRHVAMLFQPGSDGNAFVRLSVRCHHWVPHYLLHVSNQPVHT